MYYVLTFKSNVDRNKDNKKNWNFEDNNRNLILKNSFEFFQTRNTEQLKKNEREFHWQFVELLKEMLDFQNFRFLNDKCYHKIGNSVEKRSMCQKIMTNPFIQDFGPFFWKPLNQSMNEMMTNNIIVVLALSEYYSDVIKTARAYFA